MKPRRIVNTLKTNALNGHSGTVKPSFAAPLADKKMGAPDEHDGAPSRVTRMSLFSNTGGASDVR